MNCLLCLEEIKLDNDCIPYLPNILFCNFNILGVA